MISGVFLVDSLHFWDLSSRLVTFSFALEVSFVLLTEFIACNDNRDCLITFYLISDFIDLVLNTF